jgi:hypothetical protein
VEDLKAENTVMGPWASATVLTIALLASGSRESLLEAPASITTALRERFGPQARVLSLEVRPEGWEIQVQDPTNTSHVDRYAYEDGELAGPEPVAVGRNQKRLEAQLFPLSGVDLSVVPRLLADAEARARAEQGRVTHVRIERGEGYGENESWGRPLIRVHVSGPRTGAVVEYELDGKHRHVTRW